MSAFKLLVAWKQRNGENNHKSTLRNPGEKQIECKLSTEGVGGNAMQNKKKNATEMHGESTGGCRMKGKKHNGDAG